MEEHRGTWWEEPLRACVKHRRVIVVGGPAVFWTELVPVLRRVGAADVLVVGTEGMGVGPPPDAQHVIVERPPGNDFMTSVRHAVASVAHPPPPVVDAVESFDPNRRAVVFGSFLTETPTFVGRPLVAHRRPEWVALEDKTRVDALFDHAGVERARSEVTAVGRAACVWRELDAGAGTVWAADARDGYHGGATRTRWVTDDAEAAKVTDELAAHADRVRVMPFLEGVATSIHGIVLSDGVVSLRPVELVTLRQGHHLRYSGCATFWDPPPWVREQMRASARRLGERLRDEVDFRGAFTLDGVATAEGFRPTELNPRFGAGLGVITRGLADLPLHLVLDLVVGGVELPISAGELETEILTEADARRTGASWQLRVDTPRPLDGRAACYREGEWRWAEPEEPGDGLVMAGENYARVVFDAGRTPVGQSVGARAAAFWRFADREMGTNIGPLEAPVDVWA